MEPERVRDPGEHALAESARGAGERRIARVSPHDDLSDQRVVVHRHLASRPDADVASHARPLGQGKTPHGAGLREKAALGIFGIDPELDRRPARAHRFLRPRERLALREPDLLAHEVEPQRHLGDGMLYL